MHAGNTFTKIWGTHLSNLGNTFTADIQKRKLGTEVILSSYILMQSSDEDIKEDIHKTIKG